ncbi:MAG: DNA-3-methyladenine glycosylase I [Breznakia sp.]
MKRCDWATESELERDYHDTVWGKPCHDDAFLFEMLVLEFNQAGLSWSCILKKRENFKAALDNFDYKKIALYDDQKKAELLENKGIIRNRLKINALVHNAKVFMEIQAEFGSFSNYIWGFVEDKTIVNHYRDISEVPVRTALSDTICKDMKRRGIKFWGSVIMYSYMQAIGIVNDHLDECFCK